MVRSLILPMMESEQHNQYLQALKADAQILSSFIKEKKSEVRTLADLAALQGMNWDTMKPILTSHLRQQHDSFEKFIVGLANGHFHNTQVGNPYQDDIATFNDSDPNSKPKSLTKRDYWQVTIQRNSLNQKLNYVSNPMISYTTNVKQVVITSTIHDETNQVVGLLGGSISWQHMTKLIDQLIEKSSNRTADKYMLISKDGNYWYHWNSNKVIQPIRNSNGDLVTDDMGETSAKLFNILAETSSQLKSIGRNMVSGKQGSQTASIEGKTYQIFFTPINDTNYSLAKAINISDYRATTQQLLIYLMVSFIAGMFVYIFCVYLIPRDR